MNVMHEIAVLRNRGPSSRRAGFDVFVSRPQEVQVVPHEKVEAVPEIDDRADHEGIGVLTSLGLVLGPLPGAARGVLLKICSWPEPVAYLVALDEIDVAYE